jgi:hypothetical protein
MNGHFKDLASKRHLNKVPVASPNAPPFRGNHRLYWELCVGHRYEVQEVSSMGEDAVNPIHDKHIRLCVSLCDFDVVDHHRGQLIILVCIDEGNLCQESDEQSAPSNTILD